MKSSKMSILDCTLLNGVHNYAFAGYKDMDLSFINAQKCLFQSLLSFKGVQNNAFAGYEDMGVLDVKAYTFSKGKPAGHFIVSAGFCSIERAQKT
jgi:hypothetical protein